MATDTNQVTQQFAVGSEGPSDPNQTPIHIIVQEESGGSGGFGGSGGSISSGITSFQDQTPPEEAVKIPGIKPPDNSFFVHVLVDGQSATNAKYKFILDNTTSPPTYTQEYDVYVNGEAGPFSNLVGPGSKMLMFFTGTEVVFITPLLFVAPV